MSGSSCDPGNHSEILTRLSLTRMLNTSVHCIISLRVAVTGAYSLIISKQCVLILPEPYVVCSIVLCGTIPQINLHATYHTLKTHNCFYSSVHVTSGGKNYTSASLILSKYCCRPEKEPQFKFIYFNHMNLAEKSTIHMRKTASVSLTSVHPDLMKILGDISCDFAR